MTRIRFFKRLLWVAALGGSVFFALSLSPFRKGAAIPYPERVPMVCLSDGSRYELSRRVPLKPDAEGDFHPVTEYLKKFRPFSVSSPLLAWKWGLDNLKYRTDEEMFRRPEVWQTARSTYMRRQGDCEDLSLFLCDWLRAQGESARVAVGECPLIGWHAWVLWDSELGTYVMETTGKDFFSRVPREALIRKNALCRFYAARSLFNETGYWVAAEEN